MSFTDVFGGATIYPAGQTYLSLTFAVDQELAWPIEQAIAGQNVVSSIMDLNATAAGLNVDMPDARQVSQGVQSVFNNIGANSITVRDASGGTIISLGSGEAWVVYLTDNTTEAGTWRTFQLGASVSVASASALAGAGLKSIGSTLNQRIAPTSTAASPVTWTDANRAQLTVWTGGLGTLNFPDPGVVGSDWFSMVRNSGSGDLTLTPPSGTIDSVATLALSPGESAIVVTDGTNFFTIGLGQSATGVFDFVEINVAGSGDFVLAGVQLNRISYRFIGALTGNRNIVVPSSVQQYWVDNSTTGAFSLFVNTVGQITPVEVIQGQRNILYCDGTNVLSAESSSASFPVAIAQGGTGAITAATALANLGGVPLTRLLNTNALSGLAGGGDLTADRNFVLDTDNLTVENTVDIDNDTLPFYDDDAGAMRKTAMINILGKDEQFIGKTTTTNVANSTTVVDDGSLVGFNVLAGATYAIEAFLFTNAVAVAAGFRFFFQLNTASLVTFRMRYLNVDDGGNDFGDLAIGNVEQSFAFLNQSNGVVLHGFITTSGAGADGTVDFQWAQHVANVQATFLEQGSWMKFTRTG